MEQIVWFVVSHVRNKTMGTQERTHTRLQHAWEIQIMNIVFGYKSRWNTPDPTYAYASQNYPWLSIGMTAPRRLLISTSNTPVHSEYFSVRLWVSPINCTARSQPIWNRSKDSRTNIEHSAFYHENWQYLQNPKSCSAKNNNEFDGIACMPSSLRPPSTVTIIICARWIRQ